MPFKNLLKYWGTQHEKMSVLIITVMGFRDGLGKVLPELNYQRREGILRIIQGKLCKWEDMQCWYLYFDIPRTSGFHMPFFAISDGYFKRSLAVCNLIFLWRNISTLRPIQIISELSANYLEKAAGFLRSSFSRKCLTCCTMALISW